MTFDELSEKTYAIFGIRDRYVMPDLDSRVRPLSKRIMDLKSHVDHNGIQGGMGTLLSSITRRTATLAQHDPDLKMADYMGIKYGDVCCYCGKEECDCGEIRGDPHLLANPPAHTRKWTIKEWQEHLRTLYLPKNEAKGIKYVVLRLQGEVTEIGAFFHDVQNGKAGTVKQVRRSFALEICDIYAWVIGVANLTDVDLEAELIRTPLDHCRKCCQSPCNCIYF